MYIPVELMPSFLRAVSRALPLTYMVEGMRYVTGVADMSPTKFLGTAVGLGSLGMLLLPVLGRYVVTTDRR